MSKNPFDDPLAHELLSIILELKTVITNSEGREEKRRKYDHDIVRIFDRVDRAVAKTKE